jgi:glycosyltransferase involved in cell wall biosynthesis
VKKLPILVDPLPIAVVIPAHNAERFLKDALESIRGQTVRPAEIILVDDGSSDATAAIGFAHQVTVISQPQMGHAAARNTGIRATSQPWIAFLDADDVWETDKLEAQWVAVQTCSDVGIVATDFSEFDADGSRSTSFLSGKVHYQRIKRTQVAPSVVCCDPESLREEFWEGNFMTPSATLIRRDLLLRAGLFDPSLPHLEDRDCWLRLFTVSARVAVVERPLMRSRIHQDNLSHDQLEHNEAGIMLTERILSNPTKYPSGAADRYRKERPAWHLNAGRFAEERGMIRQARRYYFQAWRFGGGLLPLALTVLSYAPAPMRRVVRTIRHL